jgi:hypothetical protein
MFTRKNLHIRAALLLAGCGVTVISACSGDGQAGTRPAQMTPGMLAPEDNSYIENAGALLWAQNCIRCHNMRTPATLSDREWQIVMHHMRLRANLTGEQQEAILQFLQAAN